MKNGKILWADDEIDLLKPHILFLKQKGYEVTTVSNGRDALEKAAHETFDLIILDENMPGLSGLDTLGQIKMENPEIPVVMITKSEEENIMNQAIETKYPITSSSRSIPIRFSSIKKISTTKRSSWKRHRATIDRSSNTLAAR